MSRRIACFVPLLGWLVACACCAEPPSEASLRAADAEQMRIIVEGDAAAQEAFMHPHYLLNAPTHRVLRKPALVKMLSEGKMASDRFERSIEGVAITDDVGIVMGHEVVQPGSGSNLGSMFGTTPLQRRFTNVYLFRDGRWMFLARQATVVDSPDD